MREQYGQHVPRGHRVRRYLAEHRQHFVAGTPAGKGTAKSEVVHGQRKGSVVHYRK